MKKVLLYEFVLSVSGLLTLLAILTLPVATANLGYTYVGWTWSDLEKMGIVVFNGLNAGAFTLIAAILAESSSKFISTNPGLIKILNIVFIVAALWLFMVTYIAVGEAESHSLTGLPLYIVLLGGSWLLKKTERFA
jgi:hypothetical protein